jgi:hypothetical protein
MSATTHTSTSTSTTAAPVPLSFNIGDLSAKFKRLTDVLNTLKDDLAKASTNGDDTCVIELCIEATESDLRTVVKKTAEALEEFLVKAEAVLSSIVKIELPWERRCLSVDTFVPAVKRHYAEVLACFGANPAALGAEGWFVACATSAVAGVCSRLKRETTYTTPCHIRALALSGLDKIATIRSKVGLDLQIDLVDIVYSIMSIFSTATTQ